MEEKQYPKILKLKQGPSIHASFFIQKASLEKIELKTSSQSGLSWSFVGKSFPALENALSKWMQMYVMGKFLLVPFTFPLDNFPNYTHKVLYFLQTIPFGEHLSYQEVAVQTENPKAARAVGNACSINPFPLMIPCHRILAKDGFLGGFSGGLEVKKRLLDFEQISYR